jgi:flagellar biosynthesis/type III secretory pathway chaperone
MVLLQALLDCLEQERQALIQAREEAILELAKTKETILAQLQHLRAGQPQATAAGEAGHRETIRGLQRQALAANQRNRAIIEASLEVIQDFLAQLQPPGPGTYQAAGKLGLGSGAALFRRQA